MMQEDGLVRLFFHGIRDREYQVPATTTIKEVKKMIQPDALVYDTDLDTQILRLQLSDESNVKTLMTDEDRTLESYGLNSGSLIREVSIKYSQKRSVFVKFPTTRKGGTIPLIRVSFCPEKETVESFKKQMLKELKTKTKLVPQKGLAILLRGKHTGRKFVRVEDYNPSALFARTLLNDIFGRWSGVYKVIVLFIYDRTLNEKQLSELFDKISI
ncbi:hypothetical protein OROHE_003209 [Orobanche hederae]